MEGCVEDAKKLHYILESLSISGSDSIFRRVTKFTKWNTKKREILQLCKSLEKRKQLMTLSGVYHILEQHDSGPRMVKRGTIQPPSMV